MANYLFSSGEGGDTGDRPIITGLPGVPHRMFAGGDKWGQAATRANHRCDRLAWRFSPRAEIPDVSMVDSAGTGEQPMSRAEVRN
jgi:hypothetical protein